MKLHKDSFIVRYAYFGSDGPPKQTSICPFFWRCVFRTLLYLLPFALLIAYTALWLTDSKAAFIATSIVVAIPTAAFLITKLEKLVKGKINKSVDLYDVWLEQRGAGARLPSFEAWRKQYRIERSLFWATFYSFKDRVCPIITIER